jgi:type IV fimbrial biogenesis protein FimT
MVLLRTGRVGRRRNGFTLIELMVTLSIAGVLLAVGLPSLSRLIANNRVATQTNEFVGALNLARSEAVRRSHGVSIRSSGGTIDFASGWKVFKDTNLDGADPTTASDVLRESNGVSGNITVKRVTRTGAHCTGTYADATGGDPFVVFNSRGGNDAGGPAFFRICDAGNSSVKGRIVQVGTVGKVSLDCATITCP